MTAMFLAKRADGRPLYRVILDHIEGKIVSNSIQLNDLIPDKELKQLMTADELPRYYAEAIKASEKLEEKYSRTLRRARNKGYILSGGEGQIEYSNNYKKRSNRALTRSFSLATTTDAKLLDADGRSRLDKHTRAIGFLLVQQKMTAEKLAAHERQMKALSEQQVSAGYRQTVTDDDIADLKKRLAQLESKRV